MNKLPLSRSTDIVVQETGRELLIYDLVLHKAYNLNETSRIVFEACDGRTSVDDLKRQHNFTGDLVYLALDELKSNNLIFGEYQSIQTGVSRREIIKRVAFGTMVALPVVSVLAAPRAAFAQSLPPQPNGESCTAGDQCISNICTLGRCCSGGPGTACANDLDCCFLGDLACLSGSCCVRIGSPCNGPNATCCPGGTCQRDFPGSPTRSCKP